MLLLIGHPQSDDSVNSQQRTAARKHSSRVAPSFSAPISSSRPPKNSSEVAMAYINFATSKLGLYSPVAAILPWTKGTVASKPAMPPLILS